MTTLSKSIIQDKGHVYVQASYNGVAPPHRCSRALTHPFYVWAPMGAIPLSVLLLCRNLAQNQRRIRLMMSIQLPPNIKSRAAILGRSPVAITKIAIKTKNRT